MRMTSSSPGVPRNSWKRGETSGGVLLERTRIGTLAEKTQITQIEDGFDFLGQNVRDYGGTILVKPSRKNVATFLAKVRGIIKASEQATAGHLIVHLNPVIRGWANYHRHVASKRTFTQVDDAIFRALWQWAKRRHPKKPRRWVKDKYFGTIGGRHWVFQGTVVGREGSSNPSNSSPPRACRSNGIPRSKGKRIPMTPPGNRTSRNASA